ncbi:MAG: hypothetical protein PHC66_05000 [Candidatus Nanoarchaeia archaeon]|nr:hypothetical protein [Candidatus Nanoarchaeia archaeon]MDD5239753.1 hypothetical protein [Candidatus Nanoarchaeia archaeon]
MGIFDFFKKKTDEDLGDLGADLGPEPAFPGGEMPSMQGAGGLGGMPGNAPGNYGGTPGNFGGAPPLFAEQAAPPPPPMTGPSSMSIPMGQPGQGYGGQHVNSDILASRVEVISSKLDALRTSVDRINEKLDYIERMLVGGRRYG